MTKYRFLAVLSTMVAAMGLFAQTFLEDGFKNPPAEARARTWWHWMNGNVSRKGITADLEAMSEAGVQEAILFNVDGGIPEGDAGYMSPKWLEMVHFAVSEAQRLGLDFGIHNSAGWSSTGGPWVTPDMAMQTIVSTDTVCHGGRCVEIRLQQPFTRLGYYRDIAVVAFPKPEIDSRIPDLDIKMLGGKIRNRLEPAVDVVEPGAVVSVSDIVDLTELTSPEGVLQWNAPAGEWVIVRIGHTPTGAENRPSPQSGRGLEIDKMSREAVDMYWKHGIAPVLEKLGDMASTTLNNCLIDSYEVGCTNYTPGFDREFARLRGYSLRNYLPVMAGYYVGSGEETERFLWDYRRTIGDLITENYYSHFAELCHRNGMQFSVEPYWGPYNSLDVGDTGDIPMCEFWSGDLFFNDSPRIASSSAHVNGRRFVGAEAFTGNVNWLEHPATIRNIGEKAWTNGVNRLIFHTYAHQPWEVGPGLPMGGNGIEFNRHNTWWKHGKVFLDYIGRSQFLLQQGHPVADVLVFVGESSPNDVVTMPEITEAGFDYDLIGPHRLMELTAKDGVMSTPSGGEYRVLVLNPSDWMTPEILAKVEELASNGAIVIGRRPVKSPSLKGYPICDIEVSQKAAKLWDTGLVKDCRVEDILASDGFVPDFSTEHGLSDDIGYTHRRIDSTDIYLVDNTRKSYVEETCRFRVNGYQPELWNPETGEIEDAAVWYECPDGTTAVSLRLEPEQALFVVFRRPVAKGMRLTAADEKITSISIRPIPGLKVIKAEYGSFLPDGLMDVTDDVSQRVKDGQLDVSTGFHDPAQGYIKELRVAYMLDGKYGEAFISENEWLSLKSKSPDGLRILRAVYGKFDKGMRGIPPVYTATDVTAQIKAKIDSGIYIIPVAEIFSTAECPANSKRALRVECTVGGDRMVRVAYDGETMVLGQEVPHPRIIKSGDNYVWQTPYAGSLSYTTSSGKEKVAKVKSVPEPIVLSGKWQMEFPLLSGENLQTSVDTLTSWSESADNRVRYFSGTATYKHYFLLPKSVVGKDYALELDLGDVRIMAEVIVNGKSMGVLWKAPYRIVISDYVKVGDNELEIRVTNLWPNALIGDERFPVENEWEGDNLRQWPQWLDGTTKRTSQRITFTTRRVWNKGSQLLPSGLLGPVIIRPYHRIHL